MDAIDLSLTELERRLRALPDGPAGMLVTPRGLTVWNAVGTVGIILGLSPSLLIEFMPPRMWMAFVAQMGLVLMVVGYLPGFVRTAWVLAKSFAGWRKDQVRQLDHDIVHFRRIGDWLATFPREVVDERLRFVRAVAIRLSAKAALLCGSLDKLGVAPIAIAAAIQLRNGVSGVGALPWWQIWLGLFLAITYLLGFLASLMRLRLQSYEMVLTEAIARDAEQSGWR